jgi:hypothetical protein
MAFHPITAKAYAVSAALLWFGVTPGAGKGQGLDGLFDHPAGFFQAPFDLRLNAPFEGAVLVYTTNGARAQSANGIRYTKPIAITTTTIVRVSVFGQNTNLVGTVASTHLFVPDILRQGGEQFSKVWGRPSAQSPPAHYAMTMASEDGDGRRGVVADGLKSIPTLSIIADPSDLFAPEEGIYAHPLERGGAWERPVSVELIDAAGRLAFQCGAGLRIHGSMSRHPEESPKHSFRLSFRSRYGVARLRFPLFGAGGPQEFDDLILRAGSNDSWLASDGRQRRTATYIRDEWMRQSMLAMGYPSARGIFVHLYLNGLYWGLYNLCERLGPSLLGSGPSAEAFDSRKADQLETGDEVAWDRMMALANAGVADERSYEELRGCLDLQQFADYMILNLYAANSDWDRSANWCAIRPRKPGGQFRFLVWDAECTLGDPDADTVDFDDDESPARLFQKLSGNAAFRKLFAARVKQLLFGPGPLAPDAAAGRYRALANSVSKALPAEAARWGTYRRDVHPYRTGPFERCTVATHWQPEVDRLLTTYFPQRREILVRQLQERGLFPNLNGSEHN